MDILIKARARIQELEELYAGCQKHYLEMRDRYWKEQERVHAMQFALKMQKDLLAEYHKLNCAALAPR